MQSVFQVLKEVKPLVWIFVLQNLPQLAYFIYLLYTVSLETHLFFFFIYSLVYIMYMILLNTVHHWIWSSCS